MSLPPVRPFRRLTQAIALSAAVLGSSHALAGQGKDFAACLNAPAVTFHGSIVDAAIATPQLSTLVSLVVAANLVGPLSAPGELTVFAPTNDAFAKVPPAVLGAIGGDVNLLTQVLTYHVSAGSADPRRPQLREIKTLQGQSLFIENERRAGPQVNQSKAACTAVKTTNGTVWLIDSVLLPQFR